MNLEDRLAAKKEEILQIWFDRILQPYPPDRRRFFRENKSPYSNPVGAILKRGMEDIFDALLQRRNPEAAKSILESVMKVRAVENLPPSQAGIFLSPLKTIIANLVGNEKKEEAGDREWWELKDRIDRLDLLGINLYSECRAKVNQLKIKEREERMAAVRKGRAGG